MRLLPFVIVAVALIGCAQANIAPDPVTKLTQSKSCKGTVPMFGYRGGGYYPPKASIDMNNDGNWCLAEINFINQGATTVPYLKVIKNPDNGEIMMGPLQNNHIRFAYHPKAGFVGTDHYEVDANTPRIDNDIPITVTVTP